MRRGSIEEFINDTERGAEEWSHRSFQTSSVPKHAHRGKAVRAADVLWSETPWSLNPPLNPLTDSSKRTHPLACFPHVSQAITESSHTEWILQIHTYIYACTHQLLPLTPIKPTTLCNHYKMLINLLIWFKCILAAYISSLQIFRATLTPSNKAGDAIISFSFSICR